VLPQKWSIVGEFSPNFDSNYIPGLAEGNNFFSIDIGSASDRITFEYTSQKRLRTVALKGGSTVAIDDITTPTFVKNQIYRFLIMVKSDLIKMYLLKNNGTLEIASAAPTQALLAGLASLYAGKYSTNTDHNANSFFRFIKLLKNWVPKDDGVAELTLRGLYPDANQELVVNGDFSQGSSGWTMATNSVVTAGELVITVADATLKQNYQKINVLPNTKYKLTVGKNTGRVSVTCYTKTDTYITNVSLLTNQTGEVLYTTPASCAWINIICDNFIGGVATSGTFTFDNISFKFANENAPSGFDMPNLVPLFSDARWIKHANASVSADGKTLTLNATVATGDSYIDVPVLPNNKYEIRGTLTGTPCRLHVTEQYNTLVLSARLAMLSETTSNNTVTTPSNCNMLRIILDSNGSLGTFTFSNISLKLLM
jgi:hypothetical protein